MGFEYGYCKYECKILTQNKNCRNGTVNNCPPPVSKLRGINPLVQKAQK
ncbi:hypothetical protein PL8927_270163 [Planktothrix serta PCC 8927]|uniref:Uncharacterized protein n=1 Tax=Planktothrix serta PCC 8927 TaxID=671068 RepID=A0A7Z9BHF6_9CYAN|nr:hypothetical protein PL8927_270163 [Planktothrix serta PCC 8927]